MVTKAVYEDEKKNYRDAYHAYCEGLQHFVPLISAETDTEKRVFLQQTATNYMERAEEIKRSYQEAFTQQSNSGNSDGQAAASSSTAENPVKQALKPASNYKQMCKITTRNAYHRSDSSMLLLHFHYISILDSLFASTPQVQHALEIGRQAELYSYEQNHTAALDRYTSALNVLVPLLPQEPSGIRKDLLQKQVLEWMREAESSKALVMAHKATDNKSDHQHCCIQ